VRVGITLASEASEVLMFKAKDYALRAAERFNELLSPAVAR
jgi:hypothetical protein